MKRRSYLWRVVACIVCCILLGFGKNPEADSGITPATINDTAGETMQDKKPDAIEPTSDDVIRLLAIGNSFSVDALENYLYDLAKAAGKKVIIGNLAIAGGSLEQHVSNAEKNLAIYNYTRLNVDGNKTTTFNHTLEPVIKSEPWDYISLQQVSNNSGRYETFVTPLPLLHTWIKARATNPSVKFVLHQTWAYAKDSDNPGFVNYDKDQQKMYEAITSTYRKAKKLIRAKYIIPAGTAIQNAGTSFVGDHFTKDGYHLEQTYARFTVACTWFEKLFKQSVVGNAYNPETISNYYKEMAQAAAHFAVKQPNKVTVLKNYREREK
jgi:hypothetical protein